MVEDGLDVAMINEQWLCALWAGLGQDMVPEDWAEGSPLDVPEPRSSMSSSMLLVRVQFLTVPSCGDGRGSPTYSKSRCFV